MANTFHGSKISVTLVGVAHPRKVVLVFNDDEGDP
jgi:hypothetical protein